jgi:multidrug resistance efflux pump
MLFCFFCSRSALADETSIITPITKGSPAPYTGVLLSPEAVAKIVVETQNCQKKIDVETENARAVQKAIDEKMLADVRADLERDIKILQAKVNSRDQQIKSLTEALAKSERAKSNTWLFAGGGVLAGVAITVGTVLAVGLAN